MEKDYINGQMVEFLMEIGFAIRWMEKDYLHGVMAECKLILFRFKGQYKDDKKHGYGEFTWPNGRKYKVNIL